MLNTDEAEQLYAALVAQRDRLTQTIDALRARLDKTPSKGQQIARLIKFWCETWKARYRTSYVITPAKDAKLLGGLLGKMAVEDIEARMARYLATDDQFHIVARHPLGMFLAGVNRYAPTVEGAELVLSAAPPDCRHSPPCKDDIAHTRRVSREARTA